MRKYRYDEHVPIVGREKAAYVPKATGPKMTDADMRAKRDRLIVESYWSGTPADELAARYGLARSLIYRILKRAGDPLPLEAEEAKPVVQDDLSALFAPTPGQVERAKRNADVCRDYAAGMKMLDIAAKYELSVGAIQKILTKAAVPRRPKGKQVNEAQHKEISEKYAAGATVTELAAAYGLSTGTVYAAVRKHGIARPRGAPLGSDHHPERNAEIIRLYTEENMTAEEIGKRYDITRERVCQVLRRVNAISTKHERDRIAREELANISKAIRQNARDELQAQIAKGIQMVQDGYSIRQATAKLKLKVNVLGVACKIVGVKTRYGKYRDYTAKINLIRTMREANKPWSEVNAALEAMGEAKASPYFIDHHMPDIKKSLKPHKQMVPKVATPKPPRPLKLPVLRYPNIEWTDENTLKLIELWNAGHSALEISLRLGCSRNAIIGKVFRLKREGHLDDTGRMGPEDRTALAVNRTGGGMDHVSHGENTGASPQDRGASGEAKRHADVADEGAGRDRESNSGPAACTGEPGDGTR